MLAHDRLDGFGRLVGVIEWNRGDVVMEDVSFDDAVEQLSADESKFAIDCRCCTAREVPGLGVVMRQRRIGVLEVGDRD